MNIPYIISPANQTVTFYLNGKREAVLISDPRYESIMNTLALGDNAALQDLLQTSSDKFLEESATTVVFTYKRLKVLQLVNKEVIATYKDVRLAPSVADMLQRQLNAGVTSFEHIEAFLDKLIQIKIKRVAEMLYAFLEKAELPITSEGTFIAYKGIRADNYSYYGNKETRVLTGTVNANGQILNKEGEYISVERADVDADPDQHCSTGLHVGSHNYASNYGNKLIYVEVDPLDVISVPSDCNEKCRVCAYRVIGNTCDSTDGPNLREVPAVEDRVLENDKVRKITEDSSEVEYYRNAIQQKIDNSAKGYVTVSKLKKTVGKKAKLSIGEVFRLCLNLGFKYKTNGKHTWNTEIRN